MKNFVIYLIIQMILVKFSSAQISLVVAAVPDPTAFDLDKFLAGLKQPSPRILEYHVKTNVSNRYAETVVESKVENFENVAKQVTFSVVLPDKAFITGFIMDIGGKSYKAFVKSKEEAKQLFTKSVSSGQAAAHISLSTRDSNRFTVDVNMEAKTNATFSLFYEELLERSNGRYEVITNIQPGQIVKNMSVEILIQESRKLVFVRSPEMRTGYSLTPAPNSKLNPWPNVKITGSSAKVSFKPSVKRQVQFMCDGLGSTKFDGFAGQFIVQYDVERDDQGGEVLIQDGFFVNFFAPINLEELSKHIVFILDTSGSMSGLKLQQLKNAMVGILPQMKENDLFHIVDYSNNVIVWNVNTNQKVTVSLNSATPYGNLAAVLNNINFPDAVKATVSTVLSAKSIINGFSARSSTNIIAGLEVGLYLSAKVQKQSDSYQSMMVFLTDGEPNEGISVTDDIVTTATKVNLNQYNIPIYTLSFGNGANQTFLKSLAYHNGGFHQHIYEAQDASLQLLKYYDKISTPLLNNVTFNNLPASSQLSKTKFPIFFNGSEITVVGTGMNQTNITISAKGKNGLIQLQPKHGIPKARLNRLWAYTTVKQILEQRDASKNKDELTKLAKQIALTYGFVTDVSSLIVTKPNGNGTVETKSAFQPGTPPPTSNLCKSIPPEVLIVTTTTEMTTTEMMTTETTTIEMTTETTTPEITTETTTVEITTETTTAEMTTETTTPEVTTETTTLEMTTETTTPEMTTETTTAEITTETTTPELTTTEITTTPLITTTETVTETTTTEPYITTTMLPLLCNETTFGCCHDGVSEALGPNFLGCEPLHSTADCSLPMDSGACQNNTIKWYYDVQYGGCTQFWYRGCQGNGNRFQNKDTCEDACVNAQNFDRCNLPKSEGIGNNIEKKWYFDKSSKKCRRFKYGGYMGNNNRFDTRKDCVDLCVRKKDDLSTMQDRCVLPKKPGTCSNYTIQYYYDNSYGICSQFRYSGCKGNKNRFQSKERCTNTCVSPLGQNKCFLPKIPGPCNRSIPLWYYNKEKKDCFQFIYGGCYGNANKYDTREKCLNACSIISTPPDAQDSCSLPTKKGPCLNFSRKYAYNITIGRCLEFMYGGCDGNSNKFETERECQDICVSPRGFDICNLPMVRGPCPQNIAMWYYDKKRRVCDRFSYGGCEGNQNRFKNQKDCTTLCIRKEYLTPDSN